MEFEECGGKQTVNHADTTIQRNATRVSLYTNRSYMYMYDKCCSKETIQRTPTKPAASVRHVTQLGATRVQFKTHDTLHLMMMLRDGIKMK